MTTTTTAAHLRLAGSTFDLTLTYYTISQNEAAMIINELHWSCAMKTVMSLNEENDEQG